jgi:hypothetical protein
MDDEPVRVSSAGFGGAVKGTLPGATGTGGEAAMGSSSSEPKGAVPPPEESLQVGEALDDVLLFPEPYFYESMGRRDIFVSLLAEDEGEIDPDLKSGDLTVVGILWAENDRFALVESGDGRSLILREGSMLGDGTVIRILPDRVIVHVTAYGTSRNVSLPLAQGGLSDENPRSSRRR